MMATYGTRPRPAARLDHPRNENVVFDVNSKRFKVNDGGRPRAVRGVHTLIDQFHAPPPDSVLNKIKSGHQKEMRRRQPVEWEAHKKFVATCTVRGIDGGTIVHTEMEKYVRYGEQMFRQFVPTPHAYTQRLIQWIKRVNVIPLRTEHMIYDDKDGLDFATRIDMVVWNPRAMVLEVWEIKTGYDVVFGHATGKMHGPLGRVYNNSFLDRARLQAHLATLVLKKRYGIEAVARVVLVNESCVGSTLLTPQMIAVENVLYDQLVAQHCGGAAKVRAPPRRAARKPARARVHPASAHLRAAPKAWGGAAVVRRGAQAGAKRRW